MKKLALTLTLLSTTTAMAANLPVAIDCYQTATQSKNIDAYMACFADEVKKARKPSFGRFLTTTRKAVNFSAISR